MNVLVYLAHCMDMRDFLHRDARHPYIDGLLKQGVYMPFCWANSTHVINSNVVDRTCNFYHSSFGIPYVRNGEDWHTTHGKGGDYPEGTKLPVTVPSYYTVFKKLGFETFVHGNGVESGQRCTWPGVEFQNLTPAEINARLKEQDNQFIYFKDRATHRPWGHMEEILEGGGRKGGHPVCQRQFVSDRPYENQRIRLDGGRQLDENVRTALEGVDLEKTLVLLWSNHGEMYHYYHDFMLKPGWCLVSHSPGQSFQPLMQAMQLWLIPGRKPEICLERARCIDILPTLLGLLGKGHEEFPGVDLQEVWSGKLKVRKTLTTQVTDWTYISGAWKLMYYDLGPKSWPWPTKYLLFNLAHDPTERFNLSGEAQSQHVMRRMLEEVEPWLTGKAKGKLL